MSLFNYFKRSKPSEALTVEKNDLSPREEEGVTNELQNLEESTSSTKNPKRSKYRVWTPTERAEIGKHAAEHGNQFTVRTLGAKYPGLKRQTVSDFKLAYLKLKISKEAANGDITKIVKKKADRPTLLPETLMKKVIDTVTNLRLRGAPVSSAVIRAVARGVIVANDRSLLSENGGYIDLSTDWSRQVLYRFETLGRKMTSRMATTAKIPIAPALLSETKLDFQRKIKALQAWHEIPEDLIINFDQTPLPYVCTGKRTYHVKGASNVPMVGKGKKKQITGTFTVTMTGQFLPMQLIYQGTTNRCLPKGVKFPDDWDVTCTENHWSNESKVIQHLQIVVFPYVKRRKVELNLPEDQKAMLIFDVFKGQITDKVTKFIEENECVIVQVPNNLTDQFQPLDLNVNGHAKEFLRKKFECWYAQQITDQLNKGISVYDLNVPLKLSVIKPIHANWLLGLYDHLKHSCDTIIKGFEMAGIKDALEMELPQEDPFADLDSEMI